MFFHSFRKLGVLGLGLALALSSVPVRAQTPPPPGRRGAGQGNRMGEMARQLGLTPAQMKRFQAMRQKNRTEMQRLQSSSLAPDQKRDKIRVLRDLNRKQLEAILTPAQSAKLKVLRASRRDQFGGDRGGRGGDRQRFALERMKSQLDLTPVQERKISLILKDRDARLAKLRGKPGTPPNPALRAQVRDLNRATMDKIQGLLTVAQRNKARDMNQQRRAQVGNRPPMAR